MATFNVAAAGTEPITYQWQESASETGPFVDMVGETGTSLTVDDASTQFYRVVVTNDCGSAISDVVKIVPGEAPGYACDAFLTKLNDILDTKTFSTLYLCNETSGSDPLADSRGTNDLTVINGVPGTGEVPFIFGDCGSTNSTAIRIGPSSTAGTYSSVSGNPPTPGVWEAPVLKGSLGGFVAPNAPDNTGGLWRYIINNNNQEVRLDYLTQTTMEFDSNFGVSPRIQEQFAISSQGSFVVCNFDYSVAGNLNLEIWVDYVVVHTQLHAIGEIFDPLQSRVSIGDLGAQVSAVAQYLYFTDEWFTAADMADLKLAFDRNQVGYTP